MIHGVSAYQPLCTSHLAILAVSAATYARSESLTFPPRCLEQCCDDNASVWKYFPYLWPLDSLTNDQWFGTLVFSLPLAWTGCCTSCCRWFDMPKRPCLDKVHPVYAVKYAVNVSLRPFIWPIFPYSAGLLHRHWVNRLAANDETLEDIGKFICIKPQQNTAKHETFS